MKSYALTTVARLKTFIGISNATYDTVLERIIDSTTDFIENYCGRRFIQTAYTNEVYNSDGSNVLLLKNYPISSSASFTLYVRSADDNEDDWEAVDSEDYFIDYDAGILTSAVGRFLKGTRKYKVSYTAGFNFNNSTTFLSDTVAGDLEYATWKLCNGAFTNRKGDPNVASESLGDYSVSYRTTLMEDGELKEILSKYRTPTIGGNTLVVGS